MSREDCITAHEAIDELCEISERLGAILRTTILAGKGSSAEVDNAISAIDRAIDHLDEFLMEEEE